jgi:hypothetical protein
VWKLDRSHSHIIRTSSSSICIDSYGVSLEGAKLCKHDPSILPCACSIMSATMPFRSANAGTDSPHRQGSVDIRNEVHVQQNHYIGIDVGTGSARACIINEAGDIVGLASENIGLWQPQTGYYVSHSGVETHYDEHTLNLRRNNLPQTSGAVSATVSKKR